MENPREEETWRLLVTQQKSPSPLGFHPLKKWGRGGKEEGRWRGGLIKGKGNV